MTVRTDGPGTPQQRDSAPAGPVERDAGADGLIGAELRTGTDQAGPLAVLVEPFLGDLLDSATSVLFAGAHPAEVVARAQPGREVAVLLRRVPDAAAADDDPRLLAVSVLCGAVDRGRSSYRLVVALAGLDRTTTPDGAARDWPAALSALASRVGPGGSLVVAATNAFGLPRVNALAPSAGRADDYAMGHDALDRALRAAGLTPGAGLAVYPDLAGARLVIHRDLMDDPATRDLAGRLVAAAAGGGRPPPEVATDPVRLARDAVRHGMGYAAAPGWIVVARRPGPAEDSVPAIAVSAGHGTGPMVTDRTGMTGPVRVDGAVPGWTPWRRLPCRPLLSERVVNACGRHDLAAVRDLLSRYATWLGVPRDGAAGGAPELAAGPESLIDDGAELWPLEPDAPVGGPARVVFLRGMLGLAGTLQAAGLPHPWSPTLTPARLALRLASTAGLAATEDELAAVAAPTDPDAGPAPEGPAGALARPDGYADAVRLIAAVSRELAEAREQLRFLAETLADRDMRLRQQSVTWRVLRFGRHPVRAVKGRVVNRARRG